MQASHKQADCPLCGESSPRSFQSDLALGVHYNAQGFHKTDYGKYGDKLEKLNRTWSEATGEQPPPPSREVPRSSSEKY